MPWYSEAELLPIVRTLTIEEFHFLLRSVKTVALTGTTGYIGEIIRSFWIPIHWDNGSISYLEVKDWWCRDRPDSVMFLISDDRMNMMNSKNTNKCIIHETDSSNGFSFKFSR